MHLLDIMVLLSLALIVAKLLGGLTDRIGIPSVLAELLTGVLIGNLGWAGGIFTSFSNLDSAPIVKGLSELGVLFLLFSIGLETSLERMAKVGTDALATAITGVFFPFLLAFIAIPLFGIPSSFQHTLFIAAALTATSVGITARVLRDGGQLSTVSGQIILGAAVIDDVLGIIVLAIVSAIAIQSGLSGTAVAGQTMILILKVIIFGIGITLFRRFVLNHLLRVVRTLAVPGTITVFLLSLCLIFAWLAEKAGLAGIVGAFALGIALDDVQFKGFRETKSVQLESFMRPITDFLSPVFFFVMGMSVKIDALFAPEALGLAVLLIVCGILGKVACGIMIRKKVRQEGADRLLIGLGMIPRGEVGLIFAAMGLQSSVLNQADYSAVVAMVAVTTLAAPGLIAWRARKMA